MGKHHKTEMQEKSFYQNQFVLPTGGVMVLKNRAWDIQKLSWVDLDLPGRHRITLRVQSKLEVYEKMHLKCDMCKKRTMWFVQQGVGYVCNVCFIVNFLGRPYYYPQHLVVEGVTTP